MLMTTLLLGGPPLVSNFFSGAVAAGFSSYNAVYGAAGKGGGASSQEDMMTRASGSALGPNSRENNQGTVNSNETVGAPLGKHTSGGSSSTTNSEPGQRGEANKKKQG